MELSDVQSAVISKIAKNFGFKEFEICAESGSEKGDNYLGIITTVAVRSGKKELHLVLKTSHSNEQFRAALGITRIYTREIYVYDVVLPTLDRTKEEFGFKHPFQAHTQLCGSYVGHDTECLVMEDLRIKHFKLWNRKVPMNPEHITAVLKEYAKLHSLGLALRIKNPQIFDGLVKNMGDVFLEPDSRVQKIEEFTGNLAKKLLGIVKSNNRAAEAIEFYTPKLLDYYVNELIRPEHKLAVLHGDCWNNNIMFKYKVNKSLKQYSKCGAIFL